MNSSRSKNGLEAKFLTVSVRCNHGVLGIMDDVAWSLAQRRPGKRLLAAVPLRPPTDLQIDSAYGENRLESAHRRHVVRSLPYSCWMPCHVHVMASSWTGSKFGQNGAVGVKLTIGWWHAVRAAVECHAGFWSALSGWDEWVRATESDQLHDAFC